MNRWIPNQNNDESPIPTPQKPPAEKPKNGRAEATWKVAAVIGALALFVALVSEISSEKEKAFLILIACAIVGIPTFIVSRK